MPSTSAGVSPASFSARRAASACNWIIDISGTTPTRSVSDAPTMAILPPLGEDRGMLISRSEEHTSELQSLMRISYAVFCLKKKNKKTRQARNQYANEMRYNK